MKYHKCYNAWFYASSVITAILTEGYTGDKVMEVLCTPQKVNEG